MHITEWEASRSGAGITVAMTDAGGVKRKQLVKKIKSNFGTVVAIGGDGNRIVLNAGRDTSAEVASIAGELQHITGQTLLNGFTPAQADELAEKIRSVAASALGQRAD